MQGSKTFRHRKTQQPPVFNLVRVKHRARFIVALGLFNHFGGIKMRSMSFKTSTHLDGYNLFLSIAVLGILGFVCRVHQLPPLLLVLSQAGYAGVREAAVLLPVEVEFPAPAELLLDLLHYRLPPGGEGQGGERTLARGIMPIIARRARTS